MPELSTDVRYIKGVGEQRARALARLGVRTLGDLLNYFPRAYEDRTAVRPIAELALDETACVRAMVAAEPRLTRVRRGLDLVKLRIVDESGSADVTFFNQSYVRDQLVPGESYVFYGKAGGNLLRKTFTNPVFEREDRAGTVTGRILPLYRLTHGISNKLVVSAVECALNACGDMLPELLPAEITEQYALPKVGFAYRNVHFPPDWETLALARRRLTFEEFFVLSCATQRLRAQRESVPGERIPTPDVKEFYAALPFSPTRAQRRAADEALRDMASGKRMSRLLQGDVGSGKTLVAAALFVGGTAGRIPERFHGADGDSGAAACKNPAGLSRAVRHPRMPSDRLDEGKGKKRGQSRAGGGRVRMSPSARTPCSRRTCAFTISVLPSRTSSTASAWNSAARSAKRARSRTFSSCPPRPSRARSR